MSKQKTKVFILLKSLSWLGLVMIFAYISYAAFNYRKDQVCDKIRVVYNKDKNLGFLDTEEITKEIYSANPNWSGSKITKLKADIIEKQIKDNEYVKNAEVYLDNQKNLNLYIEPKAPLARIHDNYNTYYLSEMWDKMPVSSRFSSRVVQVSGNVKGITNPVSKLDTLIKNQIKILLDYTENNKIWKTIIDQIYITESGKIEFILTFSDVLIQMGYIDSNFEKRMEKLKQFFQVAPFYKNISEYSTLNLQFHQQVVATKKI